MSTTRSDSINEITRNPIKTPPRGILPTVRYNDETNTNIPILLKLKSDLRANKKRTIENTAPIRKETNVI